jgi:hypothetical protein
MLGLVGSLAQIRVGGAWAGFVRANPEGPIKNRAQLEELPTQSLLRTKVSRSDAGWHAILRTLF